MKKIRNKLMILSLCVFGAMGACTNSHRSDEGSESVRNGKGKDTASYAPKDSSVIDSSFRNGLGH